MTYTLIWILSTLYLDTIGSSTARCAKGNVRRNKSSVRCNKFTVRCNKSIVRLSYFPVVRNNSQVVHSTIKLILGRINFASK